MALNAVQQALKDAAAAAEQKTGKIVAEPTVADTGALQAKSQSGEIVDV